MSQIRRTPHRPWKAGSPLAESHKIMCLTPQTIPRPNKIKQLKSPGSEAQSLLCSLSDTIDRICLTRIAFTKCGTRRLSSNFPGNVDPYVMPSTVLDCESECFPNIILSIILSVRFARRVRVTLCKL
jgi:hypothetical protein